MDQVAGPSMVRSLCRNLVAVAEDQIRTLGLRLGCLESHVGRLGLGTAVGLEIDLVADLGIDLVEDLGIRMGAAGEGMEAAVVEEMEAAVDFAVGVVGLDEPTGIALAIFSAIANMYFLRAKAVFVSEGRQHGEYPHDFAPQRY